MRLRRLTWLLALLVIPTWAGQAQEVVDLQILTRIRDEGLNRSQVMDTAGYLCDAIGARLTGSPNIKKAHEWTRERLESWGLKNAHLGEWRFGRGWSVQHVSARMLSPDITPLIVVPKAWAPGTGGPVSGKVIKAKLETEQDLTNHKGKLAGLIVLTADAPEIKPHETVELDRYTEEELRDLAQYRVTPRGPRAGPRGDRGDFMRRFQFARTLEKFLAEEKPLATVAPALGDGGTLKIPRGASYRPGETTAIPSVYMAAEHYNRITRLLDRKLEVTLELDIQTRFHDDATLGYNTVAEISGGDLKDQVVMVGAHLDSWHAGTGATDDGAGVAVAMEAVRILKALDVTPRRTVRIGLWGGEEQGLLGSRAYVSEHLASRPEPKDAEQRELPSFMRRSQGPLTLKPEHAKFSAYFNLDNGTGKIRGIYAQGNAAVRPIFQAWLEPVADLGATTVTLRNTGGTDHQSFEAVGVPGFQFIQDEVEYETRTWHSNMDVYDRLQSEDLMQASVVMAWFAYNAAMRPELLPRKPMPPERPREGEARPQ